MSYNPAQMKPWTDLNKELLSQLLCFAVVVSSIPPMSFAADEAFKQAALNADQRIEAFDQALQSGDAKKIRESALALQKDPIAVKRVNNNRPDSFRTQLNTELSAVQMETKAKVRKRLAEHYGVPESDVTFFEATNPSAEVKVGQDWDVTARVQGVDVPLEIAAPAIQESFYEAAKGRKPKSLEEAAHFAHQQAVEPINYKGAEAYAFGGQKQVVDPGTGNIVTMSEGGEVIVGDKAAPLRDPEQLTNVMRHKSEIAKNQAVNFREAAEAKIEKEGLSGKAAEKVRLDAAAEAQAWEMEQARQHTKQQSRQMETRVEAHGGEVPDQVRKGNAVLDDIATNKISPEEGRRRLAEMGETPESIINKGSGLAEAAQTLVSPEETIARARTTATAGEKDTLTHNVEGQMKLKDLERRAKLRREGLSEAEIDLQMNKSKAASLEEVRARAKTSTPGVPKADLAEGGKTSFAGDADGMSSGKLAGKSKMPSVGDMLDAGEAAGILADGIRQESEAAALEGREFSAANALKNAGYGMAGGNQYDLSASISQREIERAEAGGEGKEMALLRSLYENAKTRLEGAYESSQKINQEAAEAEVERASASGEGASAARAKLNAAGTILANISGAAQVFDAVNYDSEADRQMAETGRKLQEKAKENLEKGVLKTGELERRINDLIENWDTNDPAIQTELEQLKTEHQAERERLAATLERLKTNPAINPDDPEYEALRQAASRIPRDPETEAREAAALRSEAARLIGECHFEHVYGVLEMLPHHQGRPEWEAALQEAIMRENKTTQLFENAKNQMASSNSKEAKILLQQAESNTRCAASRSKIQNILAGIERETAEQEPSDPAIESLANINCESLGPATAVWNAQYGNAQCVCDAGYEINSSGTRCVEPRERMMENTSCAHIAGSYKEWDYATGSVMCRCSPGYYIQNSVCVYADTQPAYTPPSVNNPVDNYAQKQQTANALMSLLQQANGNQGGGTYQGNQTEFHNTVMSGGQYAQQNSELSSALTNANTYAPAVSGGSYAGYAGYSPPLNTPNTGQSMSSSSPCADLSQYRGKAIIYSPTPCGHIFRGVAYNTYEQARAAFDAAQKREGKSFYQ